MKFEQKLLMLILLSIICQPCLAESKYLKTEEDTEYRATVVIVLLVIMFFLFMVSCSLLYGFVVIAFFTGCFFEWVGLGHIYNCGDLLLACLIPLFLVGNLFND